MRLIKIGHDAGNDIVLSSPKVSRIHAEITILDNGDILIEDKGSRNGTFVMNNPIAPGTPVKIMRGDAVRLADTDLQWSAVPMPEDTSAYKAIYGVGSHFNNDFQVSSPKVSRYHATIKQARKDGKFYIVDHSKNGTTVDGRKIPANTPVRIKRNSQVVVADQPLDLSRLPWPTNVWKYVGIAAACAAIIVGCIFVPWGKIFTPKGHVWTENELYNRYKSSTAMLLGIYHYEVSIGDQDPADWGLPSKCILIGDQLLDISELSSSDLVNAFDKMGIYGGTGFFVSPDGKIVTNLHVVKPWLFDDVQEKLKKMIKREYVERVQNVQNYFGIATGLLAEADEIKVDGVLDYIALIPEGEVFDPDNVIKCRELKAGDDVNVDVALLQTVSKRLPTPECTYVNVTDSLDFSAKALDPGNKVYTIGYPRLSDDFMQRQKESVGIKAIGQGGNIIQEPSEFDFGYNAATTGGASGSPIFNDHGMLIGVHHQGLSRVETQGYNYGIKGSHLRDLLQGQVTVNEPKK